MVIFHSKPSWAPTDLTLGPSMLRQPFLGSGKRHRACPIASKIAGCPPPEFPSAILINKAEEKRKGSTHDVIRSRCCEFSLQFQSSDPVSKLENSNFAAPGPGVRVRRGVRVMAQLAQLALAPNLASSWKPAAFMRNGFVWICGISWEYHGIWECSGIPWNII